MYPPSDTTTGTSISVISGSGSGHPQLNSMESVSDHSELVAVAVSVYVSPGSFRFTCTFLEPQAP